MRVITAAVMAAVCWLSMCMDWDMTMYLSGGIALGCCLPYAWVTKEESDNGRK